MGVLKISKQTEPNGSIKTNNMGYSNLKAGFNKPTIITAQQYGTKVSVELDHSDTDIDELFDVFQTLVVGLGYHESAWKQWIVDRADEYKEEEIENAVDMGIYQPSPELRKAAEEYVKILQEGELENESEFDDYGSRKPKKKNK
jgi:hypothetical protein